MQLYQLPARSEWADLVARPAIDTKAIEKKVKPIVKQVKKSGDAALIKFTKKFDGIKIEQLEVSVAEFAEADSLVSDELKQAIRTAYQNIYAFHVRQHEHFQPVETMPGVLCWRRSVPIQNVGLYIPGGTAPLFSTVLMLATPACIAGCKNIVMVTPPGRDGKINPAILFAAQLAGVHKVYKVGGAHAIAALAFGTETIPKVDKIFGPGNQFVTAAKQLVAKRGTAIDMPAGPSEVAVFADHTANPAFVAADLLSQAEHGIDSHVLLVTTHEPLVNAVVDEIREQLALLPRRALAAASLTHSKCVVVANEQEAIDLLNEYAAEHLILAVANPEAVADKIVNAGSVFLGHYTPEAAGDYASGTNHTLPTNGYARALAGVSVDSFVKKITYQQITQEGLRHIGPVVEIMAEAEQLHAHRQAVSIRLQHLASQQVASAEQVSSAN
ncbi:MAG: histidinol dehydrogenase [Cytophagales bacterium]|nr:histidinol dehydrogenase [Bernardetiaceae bacterium]MDW8203574.1 histidinol dehydrogenase [Cytophagales bacterium]